MTRRTLATVTGILVAGTMALMATDLFAQAPGGPFDQLAPGNQKAVQALFEAQKATRPRGTRPLTLDEIAARKKSGEGWGRIFALLKSRGLVDANNFGEVVNDFDRRHHLASDGVATVANRDPERGASPSGRR